MQLLEMSHTHNENIKYLKILNKWKFKLHIKKEK